jgi:hypothetical protein
VDEPALVRQFLGLRALSGAGGTDEDEAHEDVKVSRDRAGVKEKPAQTTADPDFRFWIFEFGFWILARRPKSPGEPPAFSS